MKIRIAACTAALAVCSSMLPQPAAAAERAPDDRLPLGASDVVEKRTTWMLRRGVTLTRIVRGRSDPTLVWTVEVTIPGGSSSPDPDAPPTALKDRASADERAAELRADGFDPRVERVWTRRTADYAGGVLGWRVRVGRFAEESQALAERARLVAAGYSGAALYTGWDGEANDADGPWRIDVLRVDPRTFPGALTASFGPELEERDLVSDLAPNRRAVAAVNGGFFVFDPRAGAPGDPAGVGVYRGRLLSEPVEPRPALVIRRSARKSDVVRIRWAATVVTAGGARRVLDGINRVPDLIRNCGGTWDDVPTRGPLHDVTCTDDEELVVFTRHFDGSTPTGPGAEVVVNRRGIVVEVRTTRGGDVPRRGRTVQATGSRAAWLLANARLGESLDIRMRLVKANGRRLRMAPGSAIVNGGPELVRDGRVHATPARDGMVHAGNPSFYYGWAHKRHPRTFAGVDARGRTVLVTADGRSTSSLGLSIREAAKVAEALGLEEAVNLDGGGSTTMVVKGRVINRPSDVAGERPVGDAILISRGRR